MFLTDKKMIREFVLDIKHYEGDQTKEELREPCKMCLFSHFYDCLLFNAPIRECQRSCISNYRLDKETLIDAMRRKIEADNESWKKWIDSYPEYMGPNGGKIIVLKSPDDISKVYDELEKRGV